MVMAMNNRIKTKLKNYDNLTPFVYTYSFYKNKLKNRKTNYNVSVIMVGSEDLNSIKSVLNQSFKNFELLIIDKFLNEPIKSKKIKYYRFDYENISQARNFALKKAQGNVIAYLDQGNVWDADFLSSMINSIGDKDSIYCGSSGFDSKKLLQDYYIKLNSFVHKKDLIGLYGNFDEKLDSLAEWDLIIKFTKNNSPAHLKKSLVKYNNEFNYSQEDNYQISEIHWIDIFKKDYDLIKDEFDEEYYINQYGEEIPNHMDPIHHFLLVGYKEGKNPNKDFVTAYYKNKYKIKSNPFVHYLNNPKNKKINYYSEKNKIIKTNSIYLSNYTFEEEPLVSIIILNKDGLHHLKRLFNDFESKTNYSNYEIIVVDNASEDSSVDYLKSLNLNIKIIENEENVSFAKGNNDAVNIAQGEYVLLLNNDIEPTYGWLNEMMGTIIYNDNVASVGAKLIFPYIDDLKNTNKSFSIQHAGDILRQAIDDVCIYKGHNQNKFSKDIFDSQISVNKKRLLVTGAVLLIKKIVYDELGGLDESYWYGYEDIDFNLRVHNAGYDTMFASAALLFHHESATRKTVNRNNHKVFCKKWSKYLFKKLLFDKIEKNYFFTDETLNILLVADSDFNQFKDSVHNLSSFCANNEYIVNVSFDPDDLKIHHTVDIIISFTESFDIKNIHARTNVVKVLITKNQIGSDDLGYDIVLNESNELGEKLISGLYDKYSDF